MLSGGSIFSDDGLGRVQVSARTAAGHSLLSANFDTGGAAPVSAVSSYAGLGDARSPPRLQFRATGTGQVSLSLGIHFIPAVSYPKPGD
jgi:hypothetical protein